MPYEEKKRVKRRKLLKVKKKKRKKHKNIQEKVINTKDRQILKSS